VETGWNWEVIVMGAGAILFGHAGHGERVAKASLAYTAVDNPNTANRAEATEKRIVTVDGIR
jgi:hypothetical protein